MLVSVGSCVLLTPRNYRTSMRGWFLDDLVGTLDAREKNAKHNDTKRSHLMHVDIHFVGCRLSTLRRRWVRPKSKRNRGIDGATKSDREPLQDSREIIEATAGCP